MIIASYTSFFGDVLLWTFIVGALLFGGIVALSRWWPLVVLFVLGYIPYVIVTKLF